MSDSSRLRLSEALKNGQLQEFISQQEALKVPSISKDELGKLVKAAVTTPPPQDQTSGSPVRGGSTGKKTR